MLTDEQAQELFGALAELLSEPNFIERLGPLVDEVNAAIARGKPSQQDVMLRPTGKGRGSKERVQRVEPLQPLERLEMLIRGIELTLVTPVDLALATVTVLQSDDHGSLALLFMRDSADQAGSETAVRSRPAVPSAADAIEGVVIDAAMIDQAQEDIAPLRQALAAIRAEMER
jgi:hypothetical protein